MLESMPRARSLRQLMSDTPSPRNRKPMAVWNQAVNSGRPVRTRPLFADPQLSGLPGRWAYRAGRRVFCPRSYLDCPFDGASISASAYMHVRACFLKGVSDDVHQENCEWKDNHLV